MSGGPGKQIVEFHVVLKKKEAKERKACVVVKKGRKNIYITKFLDKCKENNISFA